MWAPDWLVNKCRQISWGASCWRRVRFGAAAAAVRKKCLCGFDDAIRSAPMSKCESVSSITKFQIKYSVPCIRNITPVLELILISFFKLYEQRGIVT